MEGDNQQLTDRHAAGDDEAAPRRNAFTQLMTALAQRSTIASVVGNVLEWYDFAVFGAFAAEIGELFFPSADPVASVMQAFGVFGAAFLMRPLGGMFFGHIGDKMGRKTALMWSVLIMAGAHPQRVRARHSCAALGSELGRYWHPAHL